MSEPTSHPAPGPFPGGRAPRSVPRHVARGAAAAAAAGLLAVVLAPAASAHVHVTSADAAAGEYGTLTFRVPAEEPKASTVGLTVTFPADHPFASVSTRPVPGWTVRTAEGTLPKPVRTGDITMTKAVRTVTWTAGKDGGIAPEQFQEFELSVGPFPKAGTDLAFPATQRYSDGTVVRWNQRTTGSAEEPEHPVPTLTVGAAPAANAGHGAAMDEAAAGGSDAGGAAADPVARGLGVAAVVLGLLAVALVLVRGRRSGRAGPTDRSPA